MKKYRNEKIKVDSLIYDDEKMQRYLASVGERIYKERARKGLSIGKLSELSNLSASCICKVESAQSEISLKALLKIAVALDVSVSRLLEDKKEDACPCVSLACLQRFENLLGGADAEVVDAVLGIADEFMQALDKAAEKGAKVNAG